VTVDALVGHFITGAAPGTRVLLISRGQLTASAANAVQAAGPLLIHLFISDMKQQKQLNRVLETLFNPE
jgi:hypothetical protein